jgi:putative ABC transport system permease protein
LVVTTGFTLIGTLIAGVLPALRGSRADVLNGLKADGRPQTASSGQRRLLASMAVTQCALAIVLLAGAGLLVRSFLKLQAVDPGFDTENLLVMGVSPRQSGGTRYSDAPRQVAFFDRLEAEVKALPGVRAVLVAGGAPPQGGAVRGAELETDASPGETRAMAMPFTAVTPTYFSVMGIRMVAGQIFASTDPVTTVVIDEDFAKRFWGSAHAAVGRRFRMGADEEWHTVVGVAADVKMMGLDDRIGEGLEYYHPLQRSGDGWPGMYSLIVRTVANPDALIPAVKQRIWAIDPKLPIHDASDIHERLAESISRQRFFLTLMVLFASSATVIAAIGIYAVFAYSVAQRTHELGVRRAIGATSAQIGHLVLNEAIALAVAGACVGLAAAWMMSRTLESLLFHVTPTDPAALTAAALVLVLLAIVACYVPARRAMRVDPLIMLKVE